MECCINCAPMGAPAAPVGALRAEFLLGRLLSHAELPTLQVVAHLVDGYSAARSHNAGGPMHGHHATSPSWRACRCQCTPDSVGSTVHPTLVALADPSSACKKAAAKRRLQKSGCKRTA